jgi:hypothetical protein
MRDTAASLSAGSSELAETEMQHFSRTCWRFTRTSRPSSGISIKLVGESTALDRPRRFLAGVVEGLLGKACHDLGNPWQALVHLGIAAHLANQAGERSLLAWVLINESVVSYWADMHERALNSATAAVAASPFQHCTRLGRRFSGSRSGIGRREAVNNTSHFQSRLAT